MGNHLDLPAAATYGEQNTQITSHKGGLLTYKATLGGSSFLRTFQYQHAEYGSVVVKVYTMRENLDRDQVTRQPTPVIRARERLLAVNEKLVHARSPHVIRYRFFQIKSSLAYMLRPFLYSTLHDRLQVRPLLSYTDKLWLIYQLVEAVATLHGCGVRHGDIKAENVLLTSWNWLLISDLAPYKPVLLDVENPSDFTYYFDTGGSRRCYLAPERFFLSKHGRHDVEAHVTAAMDVFAVGCTIAELVLQEPLFFYSDMVSLVKDGALSHDTKVRLNTLDATSPEVARLVRHMTHRNPEARWTMNEYLTDWLDTFPSYFPALHTLLSPLMVWSKDHGILHMHACFSGALQRLCAPGATAEGTHSWQQGDGGPVAAELAAAAAARGAGGSGDPIAGSVQPRSDAGGAAVASDASAPAAGCSGGVEMEDGDSRDSGEASRLLHKPAAGHSAHSGADRRPSSSGAAAADTGLQASKVSPLALPLRGVVSSPGAAVTRHGTGPPGTARQGAGHGPAALEAMAAQFEVSVRESGQVQQALQLLASVLCAQLRGAATQEARWQAVRMLLLIGSKCDSHCTLEWILPYLLSFVVPEAMLSAPQPGGRRPAANTSTDCMARIVVLRHLSHILDRISLLPSSDRSLFIAFVLPALKLLAGGPVQALGNECLQCLPRIAHTAQRLLESSVCAAIPEGDARVHALGEQLTLLRGLVLDIVQKPLSAVNGSKPSTSNAPGALAGADDAVATGRELTSWIQLMRSAGSLVRFFGPDVAHIRFMPLFMWLPNMVDWRARVAFYRHLPEIASGMNRHTVDKVLLPVLEGALVKRDECADVLVAALLALARIVASGQTPLYPLLLPGCGPICKPLQLLLHACTTVRTAAVTLFTSVAAQLDIVDRYALLRPALQAALGLDMPPDLNPVLFSDPVVVTDFIRCRVLDQETPQASSFPHTLIEFSLAVRNGAFSPLRHNSLVLTRFLADTQSPSLSPNRSLHTLALQHAHIRPVCSPCPQMYHLHNGTACTVTLPAPPPVRPQADGPAPGAQASSATLLLSHRSSVSASVGGGLAGTGVVPARRCGKCASCRHTEMGRLPVSGAEPQSVVAELSSRLVAQSRMRNAGGEGDALSSPAPRPEVHNVPATLTDFKPRGTLVAHFAEHQHAINHMFVSTPRSNWLVSSSSDGSVKLWGCAKEGLQIDKIGYFSSALSYNAHEGCVYDALTLSDDNASDLTVASADSTGQLHLWDAGVQPRSAANQRPTLIASAAGARQTALEAGRVLQLTHWGPLLLALTEHAGVRAIDPRTGSRFVWSMAAPRCHGVSTCMSLVPGAPALCTGTTRGIMHIWDLRFQVLAEHRWHHSHSAIQALACPSARAPVLGVRNFTSPAPFLYVAGPHNEITLYDLDEFTPRQIIRPKSYPEPTSTVGPSITDMHSATFPEKIPHGFRSMLPLPSGGLLCAGTDKCIRYIHAHENAKASYLVCGPLRGNPSAASAAPDVKYSAVVKDKTLELTEEIVEGRAPKMTDADAVAQGQTLQYMQTQCHTDCITALAVGSLPNGPVLLSASRDGVIKAWR